MGDLLGFLKPGLLSLPADPYLNLRFGENARLTNTNLTTQFRDAIFGLRLHKFETPCRPLE